MAPPDVYDAQTQTICFVIILYRHCILILGEVLNQYESLALQQGIWKPPDSHLFLFLPGISCFHLKFHYLVIFRATVAKCFQLASATASIFSMCWLQMWTNQFANLTVKECTPAALIADVLRNVWVWVWFCLHICPCFPYVIVNIVTIKCKSSACWLEVLEDKENSLKANEAAILVY